MSSIGQLYIQRGRPNHKTWWFQPSENDELVFDELYGIELIKLMGTRDNRKWQLTDAGQQWVMANCQE